MKHASLLIAFCILFSLSAVAQSTTTVEKSTQRITITTKKVDDNGQTITETWIAEGEEPSTILKEMAINPEIMQQVEIEDNVEGKEVERLFLFKSADNNMVIEGTLDEHADEIDAEKIIIVTRTAEGAAPKDQQRMYTWHSNDREHNFVRGRDGKSNCAALGVYADNRSGEYGARINSLIDKGGAQEAGLLPGDVIKSIDEFDVSDFQTLHFALSHYRAGDQVIVNYERENKFQKVKVVLKDWADLPGHEFRTRTDCGQPELPVDSAIDDPNNDDPSFVPNIQPLELVDAQIFPNPSDGKFSFSFTTTPGPLSIAIADINGKIVYQKDVKNNDGRYNEEINLTDVPQGNYIISVTQDDKVYTQQIAKQ